MVTEKAIAAIRSLQSRLKGVLPGLTKQNTPAPQASPVVTVVDKPSPNPESGSIFVPSSRYAEYVRCVAESDRQYPDQRYLSRR